jgi:hypothetical protein
MEWDISRLERAELCRENGLKSGRGISYWANSGIVAKIIIVAIIRFFIGYSLEAF